MTRSVVLWTLAVLVVVVCVGLIVRDFQHQTAVPEPTRAELAVLIQDLKAFQAHRLELEDGWQAEEQTRQAFQSRFSMALEKVAAGLAPRFPRESGLILDLVRVPGSGARGLTPLISALEAVAEAL